VDRDGMRARVPVFEIMTATPLTIGVDASVAEAAGLMRANDVGSLIVIEDGRPSGIVTERDVVTKVAAEERAPRDVRVRDIMSAPVVAIHPDEEVLEAARLMSSRKIRRLAVVKEGALVGILTENDILRIWPSLVDVTREYDRAGLEARFAKAIEGHCEACGVYSTNLMWDRSLLACADCRGG